jgi:hypothetical protein
MICYIVDTTEYLQNGKSVKQIMALPLSGKTVTCQIKDLAANTKLLSGLWVA